MEDVTQEYYNQKEIIQIQKPAFLPFDKILFFSNIQEIEERYRQICRVDLLPRFMTRLDRFAHGIAQKEK